MHSQPEHDVQYRIALASFLLLSFYNLILHVTLKQIHVYRVSTVHTLYLIHPISSFADPYLSRGVLFPRLPTRTNRKHIRVTYRSLYETKFNANKGLQTSSSYKTLSHSTLQFHLSAQLRGFFVMSNILVSNECISQARTSVSLTLSDQR